MNKIFEKLKAINWKSKKSIIAYAVIFAILVGGTGTGLAVNYFNNNSDIVKTDVKDKTTSKPADDKKEDKKSDDKNDTDKKDENSKPTENKKEDKKDTNETSKTNDNKINSSTNKNQNTPVNNNNSNSNNNTSSSNSNNPTPTPPSNNGSGNSGNNGNNNNKPSTPPQPPVHQHSWVPDVEHIKHEEVWHWENQPIYGNGRWAEICKICGNEIDLKNESPAKHNKDHMMNGETGPNGEGGSYTKWVEDIIGYEPVKVVDQEEWTETIHKGEKCSTCGAKK